MIYVVARLASSDDYVMLSALQHFVYEAEADEMWSAVQRKSQQRWLWHAIDHQTGEISAYVLSDHKDQAFLQRSALLEPFGISQYYTDD